MRIQQLRGDMGDVRDVRDSGEDGGWVLSL